MKNYSSEQKIEIAKKFLNKQDKQAVLFEYNLPESVVKNWIELHKRGHLSSFCKLHETSFEHGEAKILVGLVKLNAQYRNAKEQTFPNSNSFVLRRQYASDNKQENVDYCPLCRKEETNWINTNNSPFIQ